MPSFELQPEFPNVLIVVDPGIYAEGAIDWEKLRDYLYSGPAGCPVTRGTHDFWVTHPRPAATDPSQRKGVYFGGQDSAAEPRRLRGIIRLAQQLPGILGLSVTQSYIASIGHEIAHYWIVFPDILTFGGKPLLGFDPFLEAFLEGHPTPDLALIARGGRHWSSYFQADASHMDGVSWKEVEVIALEGVVTEERALRRFVFQDLPGVPYTLPGPFGSTYTSLQTYNDLELHVMGVKSAAEAYPPSRQFEAILPQWISPSTYHVGLVVVFDPDDVVVFGFRDGFQRLAAARNETELPVSLDLSSFYEPWVLDRRMMLRIVRRGATYHFQAVPEWGRVGCLGSFLKSAGLWEGPQAVPPFAATDPVSPPDPSPQSWSQWNTLTSLVESKPPRAIGYLVATGRRDPGASSPMLDASLRSLEVQDSEGTRLVPLKSVDPATAGMELLLDGFAGDQLTFHRPTEGPVLASHGPNTFNLRVPTLDGPHVTDGAGDEAPKLLAKSPDGDFSVVGSVRLDRVISRPWAAGDLQAHTLWGFKRSFSMDEVELEPGHEERREQVGPYKTACIMVVADSADATPTLVRNVDTMRQAAESFFKNATSGRRELDTTL